MRSLAVTEYGMTSSIGQFVGDGRQLSNQSRRRDANRPALDTLAARLLDARELERIDIVSALRPFEPERLAG